MKNRVDELGRIRAKIARLQEQESEIKRELLNSGLTEAEGELFRAVIVSQSRKSTAWKKIAEKLGPSRQLIAAHTTVSEIKALRVSARKTS